jgi:hypothetical protein
MGNGSQRFDGCTVFIVVEWAILRGPVLAYSSKHYTRMVQWVTGAGGMPGGE